MSDVIQHCCFALFVKQHIHELRDFLQLRVELGLRRRKRGVGKKGVLIFPAISSHPLTPAIHTSETGVWPLFLGRFQSAIICACAAAACCSLMLGERLRPLRLGDAGSSSLRSAALWAESLREKRVLRNCVSVGEDAARGERTPKDEEAREEAEGGDLGLPGRFRDRLRGGSEEVRML
jgi:hypothetical protein